MRGISTRPSTEDIQALARELQALRGQIQSISSQCSEYGITIESLSAQDPAKPVYRSLGNILLEVDDRDSLLEELKSAEKALTCLLYTSPSPRDKRQSRMPSSA